jgi:hypothetical protein
MLTAALLSGMVAGVITYHVVLTVDIGPVLDELLNNLQMPLGCRPLQRSAPHL